MTAPAEPAPQSSGVLDAMSETSSTSSHSMRTRVATRLFRERHHPAPAPSGFPPYLRYLQPIASGASGEVHLASDPSLDRPVAVKLMRARSDAAELRRLHREARTLARLAHPNVVHVYEVGEHDEHVFLVMEYVDGGSLLDRQRSGREPLRLATIVTAYAEAADGLAAAHAAGIVHRDVKPANLLLGGDGRVRVADFGLAQPIDESTRPRGVPDRGLRESRVPEAHTRRVDALAGPLPQLATDSRFARGGTPAYMAPETVAEGRADARSDQYSWGVSFFEAIYGHRPSTSSRGPVSMPSVSQHGERVPAYVRSVLVRSLAQDPDDRATNIESLVVALRNGPTRVRRRRTAAIAAAMLLVTGGAAYGVARNVSGCPSADGLLTGTWDDAIRERVSSRLSSSSASFAATTTAFAVEAIDDYASRWAQTRVEACTATRGRAARSDTFLELANACLDVRRAQLDRLVEQLEGDSDRALASVDELLGTLAPIDVCTNPAALAEGREAAFDARLASTFAEIRDGLARARLAFARGLQAEALRLADTVLLDARESAAPLVVAEALLTSGTFRREMRDGSRARAILLEALDAAEAADAPSVKADVLVELARVDAELLEQPDGSSYHLERARATFARLGVEPDSHVAWLTAKALHDASRDDIAGAIGAVETALAAVRDADTVEAATLHGLLARVLESTQRPRARAEYERSRATLAARLGAEHPRTVAVGFNLGLLDHEDGDLALAAAAFEKMRATTEATQGPDAPLLATVHTALADLALSQGDLERAMSEGARALAIEGSLPFAEPTVVAAAHAAMSNACWRMGDMDAALEHTLALYEIEAPRSRPRDLVAMQINIGTFMCASKADGRAPRCAEARPYYAAAAETLRSADDAEARHLFAYAMNGVGKVALHSRAFAEATSALLVAQEIVAHEMRRSAARPSGDDGPPSPDPSLVAEVHWGLARARTAMGAIDESIGHALVAIAACVATRQTVTPMVIGGTEAPSPCER